MDIIADWIEQKILAAQAKGEFENLPGAGQPINLEDDVFVPDDLKVAYRVLKNAGVQPAELTVYQEIKELRKQLNEDKSLSYEDSQKLKRRLVDKESHFNIAMERMHKKS
jgi:hypothetical protein